MKQNCSPRFTLQFKIGAHNRCRLELGGQILALICRCYFLAQQLRSIICGANIASVNSPFCKILFFSYPIHRQWPKVSDFFAALRGILAAVGFFHRSKCKMCATCD